jgi:hypothetical protein
MPANQWVNGVSSNLPLDSSLMLTLTAEVERLLADAGTRYTAGDFDFKIVAIPSQPGPTGSGARIQRCDVGSPDTGHIREGVFYWPFSSFKHLGSVEIGDLGRFVFIAFDQDLHGVEAFGKFSGRAAAMLLTAAPSWVGIIRHGPAIATWPAVVMFRSPSARTHTIERSTGTRILISPWAASIAALRDILRPAAIENAEAGNHPRGPEAGGRVVLEPTAPFDTAEVAVLEVLGRAYPVLMKNVDVEVATRLSKQTVSKAISGLIGKQLVSRPHGERKGATITPPAKALLGQLRNSSTDHP